MNVKTKIFIILAVVITALMFVTGCEKWNKISNQENNIKCQTIQDEKSIWEKINIDYYLNFKEITISDETNNLNLITFLSNDEYVAEDKKICIDELNLSHTTIVVKSDETYNYIIPFYEDNNTFLLLAFKYNDFNNIYKKIIIRNKIDKEGSGRLLLTTEQEEFCYNFEKGTQIIINPKVISGGNAQQQSTQEQPKSCFRQCYSDAVDTLCDDFVGTLAWITNQPHLALAFAIYCEAKC